ncbi:hypothetical protein OJ997_03645 [Solirubrobacter phytolaccae]|uniref:Uncharacterized protein n=1 Tax=Solirubrobacter phytolaccae TaxID=1404360 RepID=A0A9X3N445_9ACTN|nr:hypothetical protein [Solirubrobacter phytolaccae]MDA0179378.1 hypothetical protein [Solirubrobacter phytolaccae]
MADDPRDYYYTFNPNPVAAEHFRPIAATWLNNIDTTGWVQSLASMTEDRRVQMRDEVLRAMTFSTVVEAYAEKLSPSTNSMRLHYGDGTTRVVEWSNLALVVDELLTSSGELWHSDKPPARRSVKVDVQTMLTILALLVAILSLLNDVYGGGDTLSANDAQELVEQAIKAVETQQTPPHVDPGLR